MLCNPIPTNVVGLVPLVTSPFASYVTLVAVPAVIPALATTLASTSLFLASAMFDAPLPTYTLPVSPPAV